MKHFKYIILIIPLLLSFNLYIAIGGEIIPLFDYSNTFYIGIDESENSRIYIERKNIKAQLYDESDGLDEIIIKRTQYPSFQNKELFKVRYNAILNIFAFDKDEIKIYAFVLKQYGAYRRIVNIVAFDQYYKEGMIIGPKGNYQYGTPTPDGKYCLLIDSDIIVIDLSSGNTTKLKNINIAIAGLADPTLWDGQLGFNDNLTGDYMEILWIDNKKGRLIIKDKKKKLLHDIQFDLQTIFD